MTTSNAGRPLSLHRNPAPRGSRSIRRAGARRIAGLLLTLAGLVLPQSATTVDASPMRQAVKCMMQGDKVASPATVRLGEPVLVTLSLTPDCPPESFRAVDIVLAIDRSRSMQGTKFALAKTAAKEFVNATDLSLQRIAVVSFDQAAHLGIGLSDDADAIKQAIDAIPLGPGTNISAALEMAWRDILEPDLRPAADPVIILMGDGSPNSPRDGGNDPATAALRSANVARLGGAVIYTIGLGNDTDAELMKSIAGGEANYFFSPENSELEIIYRAIALQVGNFAVRDLTLEDDLSSDVQWVQGSDTPRAASVAGRRVTWQNAIVPASGLTFSYRVVPQRVGTYAVNDLAVARFTNADDTADRLVFPVPMITVVEPPTSAPACDGVSAYKIAIHSFPDAIGLSGGSTQGCNNRFDGGDWIDGTHYDLPQLTYQLTTYDGSKVLWTGEGVPGPGRVDQRIYISVCDPPPYKLRLVTTDLADYVLCPNLSAEREITLRNFRPPSFRRTEMRWGFQRPAGGGPR